jgi:hypothetical protein
MLVTPEEVWAGIAEAELAQAEVTAGTGFGKSDGYASHARSTWPASVDETRTSSIY